MVPAAPPKAEGRAEVERLSLESVSSGGRTYRVASSNPVAAARVLLGQLLAVDLVLGDEPEAGPLDLSGQFGRGDQVGHRGMDRAARDPPVLDLVGEDAHGPQAFGRIT